VELDLLVIGSGPGGQRAAIQAAKLGKRVAVAERRNRLGGVSIHTGTIPSKTLRQATLEQLATRSLDVLDPTRVEETEQEALQQLLDRASAPHGTAQDALERPLLALGQRPEPSRVLQQRAGGRLDQRERALELVYQELGVKLGEEAGRIGR